MILASVHLRTANSRSSVAAKSVASATVMNYGVIFNDAVFLFNF